MSLWHDPKALQTRRSGNRNSAGKRIRHFIPRLGSRWNRRLSASPTSRRWHRIVNHAATPCSLSTLIPPPDRTEKSLVNLTYQTAGTNCTTLDGMPAVLPFAPTRLIRTWRDATSWYPDYAQRVFI